MRRLRAAPTAAGGARLAGAGALLRQGRTAGRDDAGASGWQAGLGDVGPGGQQLGAGGSERARGSDDIGH
jgi:hypothetical protein